MATYNKFQPFIGKAFNGVIDLTNDVCVVALTNDLPLATYSSVSEINEINYTNLSTRNTTTTSSTATGGIYKLILQDLVLTATGGTVGPFRYVAVYDDTSADDSLIAWFDYGSSITLQDTETITVNFDEVNGLFSAA